MRVKYVRWSSIGQSPDRQLLDANKYDKIYMEQVSGCVAMRERLEGQRLLADIEAGKVTHLHMDEISRAGRGIIDTLSTLELCDKYGVNVVVENLGLQSIVDDKPNPIFKLISSIIATIADQERECIAERLDAGRVAARRRGVVFGRKIGSSESKSEFLSKPAVKAIMKRLKENKMSIRDIANSTKSSTKLVMKVKKMMSEHV
jgi:DNA invertase Pin-like site-specific DNA recombinase